MDIGEGEGEGDSTFIVADCCLATFFVAKSSKELAKVAGVSHDTIAKVEKIEQKATDEIKAQCLACL